LRCALYHAQRNTFGCKGLGEEECDCGRHLILKGYEDQDAHMLARVRYLTKLEAMQMVGCMFHLNDLDRDTWDELIALKRARNWIESQTEEQRERIRDAKERLKKGQDIARKELGIPPPGVSLFSKR
jgi:hypothetical protein